jgi:hypothetical protein
MFLTYKIVCGGNCGKRFLLGEDGEGFHFDPPVEASRNWNVT